MISQSITSGQARCVALEISSVIVSDGYNNLTAAGQLIQVRRPDGSAPVPDVEAGLDDAIVVSLIQ